MGWTVDFEAGQGFVETTYAGLLTGAELAAAFEATLAVAREHGCEHFLGDCSGLAGGHSIVDLFSKVTDLEALGVSGRFREALLLPPDERVRRDIEFWQTACLNRGLEVRLFEARDAALAWLAGDA